MNVLKKCVLNILLRSFLAWSSFASESGFFFEEVRSWLQFIALMSKINFCDKPAIEMFQGNSLQKCWKPLNDRWVKSLMVLTKYFITQNTSLDMWHSFDLYSIVQLGTRVCLVSIVKWISGWSVSRSKLVAMTIFSIWYRFFWREEKNVGSKRFSALTTRLKK